MKTENTISGKCYYAVLHAKKPLTTLEVVELTKLERTKVSQKLNELKRQGFLKKLDDGSWSTALK